MAIRKDQGYCGSCYAFGACAAAEGTYNAANNLYDEACVSFSESYLIWCLGSLPQFSSSFGGCNGADYSYSELTAITTAGGPYAGLPSDSDYPYTTTPPPNCQHWNDPRTVFDAWYRIPCSDIEAMKTAIMTYGPIDVAVYAGSAFDAYAGGIYEDRLTSCNATPCSYATANHAVALVGWNDAGGYWILRNSWGSDWGEDGYMRIRYHSAHVACAGAYLFYKHLDPTPTPTPQPTPSPASEDFLSIYMPTFLKKHI